MNNLLSLDGVYIAALFVVPGYVFWVFRGYIVAAQRPNEVDFIIRILTLSGVNFALFGWIIYLAILNDLPGAARVFLWIAALLVAPALSGVLSGIWTQSGAFRKLCEKFQIHTVHVVPTGWDYRFSTNSPLWIILVLKNGTTFGGYWGANSFASSEQSERDIYVEEVYSIPEDGPWQPIGRSLLICRSEITSIEFIATT